MPDQVDIAEFVIRERILEVQEMRDAKGSGKGKVGLIFKTNMEEELQNEKIQGKTNVFS